MTSELRVDKIHNEGGDNDSGLDMSTNDVVAVKIAGSEKLRIHSDGKLGVGETAPLGLVHTKVTDVGASASAQGNLLVLEDTENGLSILSSTSGAGYINFGDSGDNNIGMIIYDHSANAMKFWSNASEALKIASDGVHTITGNAASNYMVRVTNDGNNANRYGIMIKCGQDTPSGSADTFMGFLDGDGNGQGSITHANGTVSFNAFTASHEISLPDSDKANGYDYGTLLETTAVYYKVNKSSDTTVRGIRYATQKTSSKYSRKLLGAYSVKIVNEDFIDKTGTYANNLHLAEVLGDGHILCNNAGGNIKVGDGICASATAGIGQKADKLCMIMGIAQKDITFSGSETVLVPVQYGLQQFTPWTD